MRIIKILIIVIYCANVHVYRVIYHIFILICTFFRYHYYLIMFLSFLFLEFAPHSSLSYSDECAWRNCLCAASFYSSPTPFVWKENDRCCDIIILDIWLFTQILHLKSTHNPTANVSQWLSGSTVSASQHTLDMHCKIQHKPAHMVVGDGCAQ